MLGVVYDVIPSSFDESTVVGWPPEQHVLDSSLGKALSVGLQVDDAIVIGADTIVVVDKAILGKPTSAEHARWMLELLSGRSHYVYTGLALVDRVEGCTVRCSQDYVRTEVFFGELNDHLIRSYIATGEPLDKAGAYGIQERGSVLVEGIIGDYFNVVGLPIYRLSRMLAEMGVPLFG